jgi:hypothetical protein
MFDCELSEENQIVMGRACGDRVACISLNCCDSIRTLLSTIIHELLHTIGFDHSTSERCVMNAIMSTDEDECVFLCLTNLKKLKFFHEESSHKSKIYNSLIQSHPVNKNFEVLYHEQLLNVLEHYNDLKQFDKDRKWLKKVIKVFQQRDI